MWVGVQVARSPNFAARYREALELRSHNHLRVCRILSCFSVLGFRRYKLPLVRHLEAEVRAGVLHLSPSTMHMFATYINEDSAAYLKYSEVKLPGDHTDHVVFAALAAGSGGGDDRGSPSVGRSSTGAGPLEPSGSGASTHPTATATTATAATATTASTAATATTATATTGATAATATTAVIAASSDVLLLTTVLNAHAESSPLASSDAAAVGSAHGGPASPHRSSPSSGLADEEASVAADDESRRGVPHGELEHPPVGTPMELKLADDVEAHGTLDTECGASTMTTTTS